MPRQRINHGGVTYVFPDDFPQRLARFKEESGLSWAEIARRLSAYPHTVLRWIEGRGRAQRAASDGAAGPGGRAEPRPYVDGAAGTMGSEA